MSLRIIRVLGIIVTGLSIVIIGLHALPSALFGACCCWIPYVFCTNDEDDWFIAIWVVICTLGLTFMPFIMVYVVLLDSVDVDEWNGEIQSWMIAYISWGIISYLLSMIVLSTMVYETWKQMEKMKTLMHIMFFIIGVDFGDIDFQALYNSNMVFGFCVVGVFPSMVASLPSAIVGFIANFVLEEKFVLQCSDDIDDTDLCFNNSGHGCCQVISSHDLRNSYSFMGGLASNILATWAIIRILGYLIVNIAPEAAIFAKRNK